MEEHVSAKPKKYEMAGNIFITVLLFLIGLLMIIPFIWMMAASVDAKAVISIPFPIRLIPEEFTFKHYTIAAMNMNVWRLYFNTILVTAGVTIVSIASCFMAGFSISKIKFKGAKFILVLCLATMMIPGEATLIPAFLLFNRLGLVNSYLAFYLPAAAYAFGIFLVKQFMDTLPDSLREAAIIDGAGEYRICWSIYVPLSGSIVATLVILQFLANWNNLLWPLVILSDQNKFTMQIGMAMFKSAVGVSGSSAVYPGITMAGTVMSLLPVLIVFLFMQKYIVQTIASSGIKQ